MHLRSLLFASALLAAAVAISLGAPPASADEPTWHPNEKCVDTTDVCAQVAPCLSHGAQCNTCTHAGRFHQECQTGAGKQCSEPTLEGGSAQGCGNLIQKVCVNFGSAEEPSFQCVGSIILETECMRYVCATQQTPGN